MSNKWTCPGCQSHTSRIYDVFDGEYENCPNCGLSGEVMREIHRVREQHVSAAVAAQFEELALRAGRAEAENAKLTAKLKRIRGYFEHFNWDGAEGGCFDD